MLEKYNKFCDIANRVFVIAGVAFLVVIIIASSIQVFTRYVMRASLVGTEEVTRYCFIWMSMLGGSICVRNFSNANVSMLNDALKGKAKEWHSYFIQVAVLIGASVLAFQGGKMVVLTVDQLSPILRIRMCFVYLALPVGAFGMIINCIYRILNKKHRKVEEVEAWQQ